MKVLIAYETLSGNTLEVAELIKGVMESESYEVTLYRIGVQDPTPILSEYDIIMMGTYTWGKGQTPKRTKQFIADIGYKPKNIYIFGTGDTQFGGDDLFCVALDKLAKFYNVTYPVLKIEQSPRGRQESRVIEWAEGVIRNEKVKYGESVNA